jgi:hypothetical protein
MSGTQVLFDRTSTANVEYIGTTASGVLTSQKGWQIKKITYDVNGKPLSIKNAGGEPFELYRWDDRTTLEYV